MNIDQLCQIAHEYKRKRIKDFQPIDNLWMFISHNDYFSIRRETLMREVGVSNYDIALIAGVFISWSPAISDGNIIYGEDNK